MDKATARKELRAWRTRKVRAPLEAGRILAALPPEIRVEVARQAGISRRSAYYLAQIAEAVAEGLISAADVQAIGWTKLRHLIPSLREKGKPLSAREAVVVRKRTVLQLTGHARQHTVQLSLAVSLWQASLLRGTMALIGCPQDAPPERKGRALEEICKAARRSFRRTKFKLP